MKTSELIGAQLDWAVARANGWVYEPATFQHGSVWWDGVTHMDQRHSSQLCAVTSRQNLAMKLNYQRD